MSTIVTKKKLTTHTAAVTACTAGSATTWSCSAWMSPVTAAAAAAAAAAAIGLYKRRPQCLSPPPGSCLLRQPLPTTSI